MLFQGKADAAEYFRKEGKLFRRAIAQFCLQRRVQLAAFAVISVKLEVIRAHLRRLWRYKKLFKLFQTVKKVRNRQNRLTIYGVLFSAF